MDKMDNWKHRSSNMKCKTCMWFAPKTAKGAYAFDIGRCRRHAPTMNGYPVVFVNDWCGDHKLDENAMPTAKTASLDKNARGK